jgi:hypothetical protein
MNIYLVSDGAYSDWRVRGLFSTEEKAEAARKALGSGNDVELYELDENAAQYEQGLRPWNVTITRNGYVENIYDSTSDNMWSFYFLLCAGQTRWHLRGGVWGRNEKHAIKIMNERRAQLIAMNRWPPDENAPNDGSVHRIEIEDK